MGQQYSHLSSEERILIEKLHCEQHLSIRRTAERIGREWWLKPLKWWLKPLSVAKVHAHWWLKYTQLSTERT